MAAAKRAANSYPPELRAKVLALAKGGKSIKQIGALGLGPSDASIRGWINVAQGKPPAWKLQKRARRRTATDRAITENESGLMAEVKRARSERDALKNVLLWTILRLAPDELKTLT